jgi:hypothetical protein
LDSGQEQHTQIDMKRGIPTGDSVIYILIGKKYAPNINFEMASNKSSRHPEKNIELGSILNGC